MDLLGFSLNLVSFLAITLSTGILVDDAIVEIENIVRHMRMGKSPYRAALEAADEIGLAVIAISLTIIAIFAPASFMSGIAGQFFKQFGITVSVQVFFSLLAARFVTPVLAAYFLKDHPHEDPPPGRILKTYTRLVTWSVHHYFITVLIGFGVFAASIWSITLLPQGFLPAQDTARSLLAMELPPGSQLAYTEKVTEEIVARLRKRPEVKSIFVDGGRVPPGTLEVRRAALIINYTPKADRKITQRQLELEISQELENVPDIRFWFLDENGLRAIALVVTGVDSNIVNNVASELATQMKRIPIVANVISETSLDRPELRIRPRAELAARLGVSTESLSRPSATSARRWRSSTPATARCRSASSSRTARAVTCRCCSNCGCRWASAANAAACRCLSSPTSSSIRARPASTAMTASGRRRWPPISSATQRWATLPRRSTTFRS
jgi:multidrug efflux pump subunit AcrB